MNYFWILLLSLGFCSNVFSQIKGYIRGVRLTDTIALNGVKVKLLRAQRAVFSDANGKFEIFPGKFIPDTLVTLLSGYLPDTVIINRQDRFSALSLVLFSDKLKPEVLVQRKAQNGVVKLSIVQLERITSRELRRAACCNLSESFETNASVDVNIADAVSGARKIQLLGLDGVYTQFQLENVPFLRGLEAPFGMQSFSGIWLDGIQISKGSGSVVNGHESMTGLINLSLKSPLESDRLLLNVYGNRFGRTEVNAIVSHKFNEQWGTSVLLNGSLNKTNIDENHDSFLDLPLYQNVAAMNRWQYLGKKMEAQLAMYGYSDHRFAGQSALSPLLFPFHMELANRHLELSAKTGFFGKREGESLGIIQQLKIHYAQGYFGGNALGGQRQIYGNEQRYFISINYDRSSKDGKHQLKSGASANALSLEQRADYHTLDRFELTSGFFSEYALKLNRLSWQTGLRWDYHSLFGAVLVPRVHLKIALTPKTDLRITSGRGWRSPNYLIEHNALMASNKYWVLPAELLPEISWNVGGSLVTEFRFFDRKASWTTDLYYTWFERQLVVDRDVSDQFLVFNYLDKASSSVAFQTEMDFGLSKQWSFRSAYKYLRVMALFNGSRQQQTMVPAHRVLTTMSWVSLNKRWQADLTFNLVGPMRMPKGYPSNGGSGHFSPWYPFVFGQISHQFKQIKVYLGVENLPNIKQPNPILFASNPQDPGFDATMVWGPITGVNVYGGITFILKQKKS
jgi:hypothetical protein